VLAHLYATDVEDARPGDRSRARARSLTVQTAQKAKQAKLELLVIVPLMAITVPKLADEILAGLAGVTREVEDGGPWPRRP